MARRGGRMTMQTFMAAIDPSSRQRGFSLVELMIVLMLIGVAATAVVLTIRPGGDDARAQATRLAVRTAALRDRAVIEGRAFGLWVTASGYGFERRIDGGWQPIDEGRLSRQDWQAGTATSVNGISNGRVRFDRVGLPDRTLRIDLSAGESRASVVIDAAGAVAVQ